MFVKGVALHFIGDYITQSHWMATEKVNRWLPAIVHGIFYTLPFLFITQSIPALLVIGGTHIVIDRYRLAKHFIWLKEFVLPPFRQPVPWSEAKQNGGYTKELPAFLATWLMIVIDNILHIAINTAALLWL